MGDGERKSDAFDGLRSIVDGLFGTLSKVGSSIDALRSHCAGLLEQGRATQRVLEKSQERLAAIEGRLTQAPAPQANPAAGPPIGNAGTGTREPRRIGVAVLLTSLTFGGFSFLSYDLSMLKVSIDTMFKNLNFVVNLVVNHPPGDGDIAKVKESFGELKGELVPLRDGLQDLVRQNENKLTTDQIIDKVRAEVFRYLAGISNAEEQIRARRYTEKILNALTALESSGGERSDRLAKIEAQIKSIDLNVGLILAQLAQENKGAAPKKRQAIEIRPEVGHVERDSTGAPSIVLNETILDKYGIDEFKLTKAGEDALRTIVETLKSQSTKQNVLVVGHTDRTKAAPSRDGRSEHDYNFLLAEKRAKAVADFLAFRYGGQSVAFAGIGSVVPNEKNKAGAGSAKNRRVDLLICDQMTHCTDSLARRINEGYDSPYATVRSVGVYWSSTDAPVLQSSIRIDHP